MAIQEKKMLCGVVDKFFYILTNFFSYIDHGGNISFSSAQDDCALMRSGDIVPLYGLNLQSNSNRIIESIESVLYLLKRLKAEEEAKVMINFIKNEKEYFVYLYSLNKSTIDSLSTIFGIKPMDGNEIAKSFGDYFMFNSYSVDKNTLVNNFEDFTLGAIENEQFHRVAAMLSKNVLKNHDMYQAIAYKQKAFNSIDLLNITGWEGCLSLLFDFAQSSNKYKFETALSRAQKVDTRVYETLSDIKEKSIDVLMQEYGICNAILISNNKKYVAQIESVTGFLFEENYLTGTSCYKQSLINKRDYMFDFFIHSENAVKFFQSPKKKVEEIVQRDDGSWILPDFYGKDIAGMFMNYSTGSNNNPHVIITAKTGSGKSSALLKILRSSMWIDENFKSEALENGLVKLRYVDIDYSGGNFIDKIRNNYKDMCKIYGSDSSKMRFSVLDVETEDELNPYSKPIEQEVTNICSFINTVLEATDPNSVLDNAEEDRLKHVIYKAFSDESLRVDRTVAELSMLDGYEELCSQIFKTYSRNTKISALGSEYNFLKKPILTNVIDFVEKMSMSTSISEIQQNTFKTLLKKISGLKNFSFSSYANNNIGEDKAVFYVDFGEIKQSQKDFIAIGWMLLRSWLKIERETYIKRTKQGLPRQKIFYIIEESHNFFTIPSFAKVFQAAIKEVRKFGVHFIFVSHTVKDMPDDIYKSIATKIFLFSEGDADEVRREIEEKTDMNPQRLEVFNRAKRDNYSMFIMHDEGESVCKLDMTKQDLETFLPHKIMP